MVEREACERRVYRLATLLTGSPSKALRILDHIVRNQPRLDTLDTTHLDRLTILSCRNARPTALGDEDIPRSAAEALAGLRPQQRETWVLTHVYRLSPRETARSMDCSVTATRRHLEQAEQRMREALGPRGDSHAAGAMLRYSMRLNVPQVFYIHQRRRKRIRWTVMIIVLSIVVSAMVVERVPISVESSAGDSCRGDDRF